MNQFRNLLQEIKKIAYLAIPFSYGILEILRKSPIGEGGGGGV